MGLLPKLAVTWMSELAAPRTVEMTERNAPRARVDGTIVQSGLKRFRDQRQWRERNLHDKKGKCCKPTEI